MRSNSGDKLTAVFGWLRLPFGRPRGRGGPGGAAFVVFLAAAAARLAAFSAGDRTTWSSRSGKARRVRVLTRAKLKKATLGTTFCMTPEKKRSSPCVFLPALVTTTSSPAKI